MVGRYGDADGKGCSKCPSGKSTNRLLGQLQCIDCNAGTYQANEGAATCDECAIDTFSTVGSAKCTQCSSGKYTNDIKGASVCSEKPASRLSLSSRDGVLNVFKTGMAYMITVMLCSLFVGMGYFITKVRSRDATLANIKPLIVCARLALSAASLVSEAFMLSVMFAEGTEIFFNLGMTIVTFRFFNTMITGLVLFAVFGSVQADIAQRYRKCFAKDQTARQVLDEDELTGLFQDLLELYVVYVCSLRLRAVTVAG